MACTDTVAANLVDVVVLAGGASLDLMPLTASEPKSMLCICNRPLIWYCLQPWVSAGFRSFFLCVNEDHVALRTYLLREFTGVDFYFVLVPLNINDHPSTTCDAVKAFLAYKEGLRSGAVDRDLDALHAMAHSDSEDESSDEADDNGIGRISDRRASLSASRRLGGSMIKTANKHHSGRDALREERAALVGLPRDAVLLSCDTILAGVDLEYFVKQHCSAMASASVMLFRPCASPVKREPGASGGGGGGRGEGKKKGAATAAAEKVQPGFTYAYTAVGYEEGDEEQEGMANETSCGGSGTASTAGGTSRGGSAFRGARAPGRASPASPTAAASEAMAAGWAGNNTLIHGSAPSASQHQLYSHPLTGSFAASGGFAAGGGLPCGAVAGPGVARRHRLHYMYPVEDKPEVRVTMAFAARRPQLTFTADVMDAHVYVVRNWVLHFIADAAGTPDVTVRNYIMPLLARSQHTTVNMAHNVVIRPEDKIKHGIPTHWLYTGSDVSVQTLNAASAALLPERADTLRVYCIVYEENPNVACKIVRINSENNYRAASHEIIAAKSVQLGLDDGTPASAATAQGVAGGGNESLTASAHALSLLLPDQPFSLRERLGSQQVSILASFVDSTVPPNVYITRSVIGPNVIIGPGARVTDSIVLANVEIGPKAVVTRSVIGASAVVNAGKRVVQCTVAPRCIVEDDEEDNVVE